MTSRIQAIFKMRWRGILIAFTFLILTLYSAIFMSTFAPIPSTGVLPDGSDIVVFYGDVFTTPLTQSRGLFFFDLGEKKLVRWDSVVTNPSSLASVTWIPQQQQLLFNGSIDSLFGLYFLDKEGNTTRKIETIDLHSIIGESISSDGKDIAFTHEDDLYIQSIEGSTQQRLTHDDYINRDPDWSPDNQELVFRSYRPDEEISVIVKMNRDGTNPRMLTQSQNSLNNPKWSPDGKMIAFRDFDDRFRNSIWIMNADGSDVRQILKPNEEEDTVHDFAWSPDSKHIIFVSSRDGYCGIQVEYESTCTRSLYLIGVNSKEVTRLTNKWLFFIDLTWVN